MSSDWDRRRDHFHDDIPTVEPQRGPVPGKLPATARLMAPTIIYLKESGSAREGDPEEAVDVARRSSGAPLPQPVREKFEGSLGADLGGVRVHTGPESAAAAKAIGARAYTEGSDIHFADGQYAPFDPLGMHLLAHEVAHTVQQSDAPPSRQEKLEVSSPGDAAEIEADHAADAMVAGEPAQIAERASGALAREPDPDAEGEGDKKEGEEEEEEKWWHGQSLELAPKVLGDENGGNLKMGFDDKGRFGGSTEIAAEIKPKKPISKSIEFTIGGVPGGGKIMAALNYSAKASLSLGAFGGMSKEGGEDVAKGTILGGGSVTFSVSGSVGAGPMIGWADFANASLLGTLTLTGEATAAAALVGDVKMSSQETTGKVGLDVNLGATVKAKGSVQFVLEALGEDSVLAELTLGEHDIFKLGVVAGSRWSKAEGTETTQKVEGPEFLGLPAATKSKKAPTKVRGSKVETGRLPDKPFYEEYPYDEYLEEKAREEKCYAPSDNPFSPGYRGDEDGDQSNWEE